MAFAPALPRGDAHIRMLRAHGVADARQDDFSQTLAGAAASIADARMGAIFLADQDRQWLRGTHGLPARHAHRVLTFCARAIAGPLPLLVPNASRDLRFASDPLVKGSPYIRFYAALPLTMGGQNIGALSVLDDRDRALSAGQKERLSALARDISAWLESFLIAL